METYWRTYCLSSVHWLWLNAILCGQGHERYVLSIWTPGPTGLAPGCHSITGSLLLHPRGEQASLQGLMCNKSMLALWLSTWLWPMPLTHSQTSYPWHLWALGLCLGCLASLNMWFQALTSWIGQIRMSGCYFWLPHICSSNCTRLCYLDSYCHKRHHHSFSFPLLDRGTGKKWE